VRLPGLDSAEYYQVKTYHQRNFVVYWRFFAGSDIQFILKKLFALIVTKTGFRAFVFGKSNVTIKT